MTRNLLFLSLLLSFCYHQSVVSQNAIWYIAPNGTGNGTSWTAPSGNIQLIIDNAASGDQVWIKQGNYQRDVGQFFSIKDGVSLYGGFPNTANPNEADRNPSLFPTVLEGNQGRVLEAAGIFEPISPETIIDGFTIQNGNAPTGAGIAISFCDATFRNLRIINNVAQVGFGAGMNIFNSNSTFIQVLVSGNTSILTPGNDGDTAGIKITGGTTKFYNCVVANNHAQGYVGGIWLNSNTNCYFYNSIIYGNTADLEFSTFSNDNFYALNNVNFYASNCILQDSRGSDYLYEAVQYQIYGIDSGKNLDVDPLFNADYSLQSDSYGINKGNTQAYLAAVNSTGKDLFNNNRIVDNIDIGLSEYQAVQSDILYVKPGATGDGSSWANASGNLQSMIDKQLNGRAVWVAEGTYSAPEPYFKLRDKVRVFGGFPASGNPTFEDRDTQSHTTILTSTHNAIIGNFYPADKKISSETLLDGFTITKNNDSPEHMLGIFEANSEVSYSNIVFSNLNYGALQIMRSSNDSFTDCAFVDNSAINDDGVNYPMTISMFDGAQSSFLRCQFIGNYAFQGAAMAITDDSHVAIDDCLFANNNNGVQSGIGKVIYVENSTATLTNSVFESNGYSEFGGNIVTITGTANFPDAPWLIHPLQVTIDRCTFRNNENTALAFQGKAGDQVTVNNSLFHRNEGSVGGGIRRAYGGDFYVTNCTITENHASNQWAGGILIDDGSGYQDLGTTQIRNSIIYNNTSVYIEGQDFRSYRPVQIKNTILKGSGGSANWDGGAFNDFTLPDMSIDLGGNLDADPLFVDAVNGDYRLAEGSPAINAGDLSFYNSGATPDLSTLDFDLGGSERIQESIIDIGAFEFDPLLGTHPSQWKNSISIYPNPTDNLVNVRSTEVAVKEIKVYSILGKELICVKNSSVSVAGLSKGLYIVKVTLADQKTYSTKIVKQ